jgi:hypothetical protein
VAITSPRQSVSRSTMAWCLSLRRPNFTVAAATIRPLVVTSAAWRRRATAAPHRPASRRRRTTPGEPVCRPGSRWRSDLLLQNPLVQQRLDDLADRGPRWNRSAGPARDGQRTVRVQGFQHPGRGSARRPGRRHHGRRPDGAADLGRATHGTSVSCCHFGTSRRARRTEGPSDHPIGSDEDKHSHTLSCHPPSRPLSQVTDTCCAVCRFVTVETLTRSGSYASLTNCMHGLQTFATVPALGGSTRPQGGSR